MKKLLLIALASTVSFSAFASTVTTDNNHKRPAMSAEMKQAMHDCATETGVKKSKESRPSKADMKKLGECMTAKGYEKPEGRGKNRQQ